MKKIIITVLLLLSCIGLFFLAEKTIDSPLMAGDNRALMADKASMALYIHRFFLDQLAGMKEGTIRFSGLAKVGPDGKVELMVVDEGRIREGNIDWSGSQLDYEEKGDYIKVGTIPFDISFNDKQSAAKESGSDATRLPDGGGEK